MQQFRKVLKYFIWNRKSQTTLLAIYDVSYKNQPTGHILLHSLILLTESAISRQVFLPRYSTKFSFSFGFQCSSGNLFSNVETVHLAELHHRPNHTAIISTPSPSPGSLKKVFHVCLPTACLVPRPHYCARPMHFGSRGPKNVTEKCDSRLRL